MLDIEDNAAAQAMSQALFNFDIGIKRISAVRGRAGDLLNRAEDLDLIKGVADFQNQQTGYSAALQSSAQVQKLSLFNYIG